mmetsp:Transcript_23437/g.73461  ORF Transcript_23437/g.73461 Transcript_23437/m.73461 type:complete len:435 (+) Transcript_23437:149-1453(+)
MSSRNGGGVGVSTRATQAALAAQGAGAGGGECADGALLRRSKRGKDEDGKGRDGVAGTKRRAALADVTNKPRDEAAGAPVKAKASGDATQSSASAPVTRGMAAAMAVPTSHAEASVLLQARTAAVQAAAAQGSRFLSEQAVVEDAAEEAHEEMPWKDVDAATKDDPQMCAQYVNEIYAHLRHKEVERRPSVSYMDELQSDINATMRGILVDWLVEVAEEYKLVPDTLFLSVSCIDRYLSVNQVVRSKLQLVGVTCMLIAAKYEEIYAPQVDEFCYITDNTYSRQEVLNMERTLLTTLDFELTTPTTKSFLRRFLKAAEADTKVEFLASYLAELTLVEYGFMKYMPSMVAASAVFLAQFTLNKPPWTPTLQHYAQYQPQELIDCVKALHGVFLNARRSTLPAIREKYSLHKFKCVSSITPQEVLPEYLFEPLRRP